MLAREIAEQLRALAILAEDQSLVLNIHKMALTVTPGSGDHLLASTGTRHTHAHKHNKYMECASYIHMTGASREENQVSGGCAG